MTGSTGRSSPPGDRKALDELARLVVHVLGSSSPVVPPSVDAAEGDRVADVALARRELGYAPAVGLEEGLRRTAARQVSR